MTTKTCPFCGSANLSMKLMPKENDASKFWCVNCGKSFANSVPVSSAMMDELTSDEPAEETVIESPSGGALGIAIRTSEKVTGDTREYRTLITIRAGFGAKDMKFDLGNYGSGPIVRGGGDGDPPDCP